MDRSASYNFFQRVRGPGMVFGLLILFGFAGAGTADERGRDGYAGSYLRMGLGARAMGMGGGSVALTDDAYVTYYNPAGLVFLESRWFTATMNSMALDRRLFYVGYAQSVGSRNPGMLKGGFSVGWMSAGVDRIDARDFSGNDTGSLSFWEHCFFFSFALNPLSELSIGFSGKLLYSRFPGIIDGGDALSAVGFGFDIGVIYKPHPCFTLGFTIKDLNSKYTWDTQKLWENGTHTTDYFPYVMRGGMAVNLLSNRIIITLDLEQVALDLDKEDMDAEQGKCWPASYVGGTQVEVYPGILLRGGIRDGRISLGAGYFWEISGKTIHMDYGFIPDSVAPRGNHIFTWSFVF